MQHRAAILAWVHKRSGASSLHPDWKLAQRGGTHSAKLQVTRWVVIQSNSFCANLQLRSVVMQKVSNEVLEANDVMSIVRTLEFEGKIDTVTGEDGDMYRPAMLEIPDTHNFTSVPCGVCPVSAVSRLSYHHTHHLFQQ